MQVKAQGLLNAARWIEQEYGNNGLRQVLERCSHPVRVRCATAIANNWHPVEELTEFLEISERVLGTGDGRIAELVGASGARANLKGAMIRMAFWVANPELLMKRVAGLWRQFNDEGEMILLQIDDDVSRFELRGLVRPNWLFCCTITGWGAVTTELAGVDNPVVRHAECRAKGASRCIWVASSPRTSANRLLQGAGRRSPSQPPKHR